MSKESWKAFYKSYRKEEYGYRRKYLSRYTPPDGVNKRYKVVDVDMDMSWYVSEYHIAMEILDETVGSKNHEGYLEVV